MKRKKNKGSSFENFLEEEGIKEEVNVAAVKAAIARQRLMFAFKPLHISDLPLIFDWLALPHVAQWWRETRDYEKFIEKYSQRIPDPSIGQFLICHDQKPIGFVQWYDIALWPMQNEIFPDRTYGFDIFIADQDFIGKGYGTQIIRQLIDEIIMPMKPAKIIVDPEIINERAIHVYEKIGFKKTKIVEATDETTMVTAQLMEFDLGRA